MTWALAFKIAGIALAVVAGMAFLLWRLTANAMSEDDAREREDER
jgi:hypothetical protein